MKRQNCVILCLSVTIAAIQRKLVGSGLNALGSCDGRIAMLVKHKHVQQWRGRDIWLPADFGKTLLCGRIGDADCRPVVQELAACGMLGHGFESFDDIVAQRLRLEFADGTTLQQSVDSCIMQNITHVDYLYPIRVIAQVFSPASAFLPIAVSCSFVRFQPQLQLQI